MPYIKKNELQIYKDVYNKYKDGKFLDYGGLMFICRALNGDPTEIGKYILEQLPRLKEKDS